jgi:16S rRNA processing protein RimM
MSMSGLPTTAMSGMDDPPFPEDAIEVGRIIGAWGIQGWIRVQPFSADPKALFSSRRWFLRPSESPRPAAPGVSAPLPGLLRITHSKQQGDGVVAAAQEIPDRNAAEAMKGLRVFIARSSFPTPASDEYYWVDLVGLQVVNREGEALGEVIDLLDTGAHSVLRLRRPDAPEGASPSEYERLIPFVGAYIDDVDLAARRIVADWGLDY